MPETPQTPPKYFRECLEACREVVRRSITRVPIEPGALEKFAEEFAGDFSMILTPDLGRDRWEGDGGDDKGMGPHVQYLATVLGMLAEFYALRKPPKREAVGEQHLRWAISVIKTACELRLPKSTKRFIFCEAVTTIPLPTIER